MTAPLPAGLSGAAAAALCALALCGCNGRVDPSGVAYIEVWIGGETLRTAQTVVAGRHGSAAAAAETPLASALDDLTEQARALGSRAPGSP